MCYYCTYNSGQYPMCTVVLTFVIVLINES
nr:MAG TPA: hypothetical protein [Caudoviricetes sp.]